MGSSGHGNGEVPLKWDPRASHKQHGGLGRLIRNLWTPARQGIPRGAWPTQRWFKRFNICWVAEVDVGREAESEGQRIDFGG